MNTVPTNSFAQAAQNDTNNNISPPIPHLAFATHNVRSFTNIAKQNFLIDLYSSLDIDVIGLQETNFTQSHIKPFNLTFNSQFHGFFGTPLQASSQTTGYGVGLLLKQNLANHIFRHEIILNRIIVVDLQFAKKQKMRIINAYIPPADANAKKTIHSIIFDQIKLAVSNNYHIILLGDFNANMDKPQLATWDKNFFNTIQNLHLFDSFTLKFDQLRTNYPTFKSYNSTSQINYI